MTPTTWLADLTRPLCIMALVLGLGACTSLPRLVPDLALRTSSAPPKIEGARGPLSASQSKVVLDRLQAGGKPSDIFLRHLAVEEAVAGSPLTTGNDVRLLEDGPATYQAMIAAITAARDHINLETYILEDDEVGRRFAEVLIAKQQQGVQVNLIRDSVGTIATPAAFFTSAAGRERRRGAPSTTPMNPLAARTATWALNQRDHRKLLDGRRARCVPRRHQHQQRLLGWLVQPVRRACTPRWQRDVARHGPARRRVPVVADLQRLFIATWASAARPAARAEVPTFRRCSRLRATHVVRAIGSAPDEPFSLIYATLAVGHRQRRDQHPHHQRLLRARPAAARRAG